jgi:glucose-1-phosphate cytidylyltransferase
VMEREPLERLAADGQIVAYRHAGEFHAMDTYREYLALNEMWAAGKAPWKVWP